MIVNKKSLGLLITLIILSMGSASAGPPFLTDDPQPVDFKHWEFYVASAMQFDKSQSDATLPHFEVNYGAVPNVQLHIIVPMAYSRTENNAVYGFSNTELGIKYRFIQE